MMAENNQSSTGGRGGKRAGSGRKLGAATKRTRKIADELMASGEKTPLEYMLEVMRQEVSPDLDPPRMLAAITLRFEAAKAAAPRKSAAKKSASKASARKTRAS